MIDYPYEQPAAPGERFSIGYRNYAGGGQSWPVVDTLEQAQSMLAEKRAEYAEQPAVTHRANIPVSWYIERITTIRRVELVSEMLASEPSP